MGFSYYVTAKLFSLWRVSENREIKSQETKNENGEIKMSNSENQNVFILKVSNFAYQSYRSFVKGNMDLTKTEVAKKLTRNVILGEPKSVPNTDHVWYSYGKLKILVKGGKKITCVMNHQEVPVNWEIDIPLKKWLNKKLNIR